MENLSLNRVNQLLEREPKAPAVTIYLPTHRAPTSPNMTEDQIRLKNLIHRAANILKNRDDGEEIRQALCQRLDGLLNDAAFWESQTEGLLICASPGVFEMFCLPVDTEEYVAVDTRFHLAPVMGLIEESKEYYVLAIAQHNPKLFKGDLYGLSETDIDLPESVESGLQIDEMNQKSEQQRSALGSNMHPSVFNGRGGAKNPAEEERQRFWRMIDQKILNKADKKLPLILAGIDSEVAEYKNISHYPKILDGSISGSFSGAKPQDLFEPAWQIVKEELIHPEEESAIAEHQHTKGVTPEKVATSFAEVADAAEKGRVKTLLTGMLRYTTDTVRDNMLPAERLTFPGPELSKTINDMAAIVWAQSGKIINLDESKIPGGAHMAATLRY